MSRQTTWVDGDILTATALNDEFDELYSTLAASGANSDITSLTGLDDDGIPYTKVYGAGNLYFPDYTETDQGLTGSGASVKAYVDTIGSDSATMVFRHNSGSATTTYTFSTDETIPANIHVTAELGVRISVDTGKTLTINGEFNAPLSQVFAGAGTVVFGSKTKTAHPEWWGAIVDDDTAATANYTAIMAAITSLRYHGVVQFNDGIYYTSNTIIIEDEQIAQRTIVIRGNGRSNSLIYHIGGQAAGCLKIMGDAVFATTYYATSAHGKSHVRDIALGSRSGPALHRYFTGNHFDSHISFISAGATSSYLLIEGCAMFYFDYLTDVSYNTDWINRIDAGTYEHVLPYHFIKIIDGTYDDGINGVLPGQCHEGWFDNLRDIGQHTRESLCLVSDNVGAGDGGNITFSKSKFTGPTGVTDYGTVIIDGFNRGIKFTNGSYIEAQAAIAALQGNVSIHNSMDISKVTFSSDSIWTGHLDIGEYGGAPGTYKMSFSMIGCRGTNVRLNDTANLDYFEFIGNRLLTQPTSFTSLQLIPYYVVMGNTYEADTGVYWPLQNEGIIMGASSGLTGITARSVNAGAGGNFLWKYQKARGTHVAPTIISASDIIMQADFYGYTGAAYDRMLSQNVVAVDVANDIAAWQLLNSAGDVIIHASKLGVMIPTVLEADVPKGRMYVDSVSGVLSFKDKAGGVHALY